MERKSELRRLMLARRASLSPDESATLSARAGERLFALPELAQADLLMFFVSFGSELATLPLIERALAGGKRVAVPQVERPARRLVPHLLRDPNTELAPGAYDIPEPGPESPRAVLDEIEVVIVPGLAWGEDGFRVGYGGGFYRSLPAHRPAGPTASAWPSSCRSCLPFLIARRICR